MNLFILRTLLPLVESRVLIENQRLFRPTKNKSSRNFRLLCHYHQVANTNQENLIQYKVFEVLTEPPPWMSKK